MLYDPPLWAASLEAQRGPPSSIVAADAVATPTNASYSCSSQTWANRASLGGNSVSWTASLFGQTQPVTVALASENTTGNYPAGSESSNTTAYPEQTHQNPNLISSLSTDPFVPSSAGAIASSIADTISSNASPISSPAANPSVGSSLSDLVSTFTISFDNQIIGSTVHAYIHGTDDAGELVFVTSSNEFLYPSQSFESSDVAIPLSSEGSQTSVTIPGYMTGARICLAEGTLDFRMNGASLVEPSAANGDDSSNTVNWGFVEFAWLESEGLYADLSFVDFFGMPLGIQVITKSNKTLSALGPQSDAVARVCSALNEASTSSNITSSAEQDWTKLCQHDDNHKPLRVLAPSSYMGRDSSAFSGYWEHAVNQAWEQSFTVITPDAGDVDCLAGESLSCSGTQYSKPSDLEIFGCSGLLANSIGTRLCAALNRGTLQGETQPSVLPDAYYQTEPYNRYSQAVHYELWNNLGYAFPYDDVAPDPQHDVAGVLSANDPDTLQVIIRRLEGHT